MLGFGTHTLNGEACIAALCHALSSGYRLIDTAKIYGNESSVGQGIKKSGINRDRLCLTSKLWLEDAGFESTKAAFQTSLQNLDTDYLDLYLIHRPHGDLKGTWLAMEELYLAGKIKAIGVSNFTLPQIEELMTYATIKPVMNQVETHVFFQQEQFRRELEQQGIQLQTWSPFAERRNNLFTNETLTNIAKKHRKSIAQVCLRWHYQRGIVSIPRSSSATHIEQNLEIFDFYLSEAELEKIKTLDLNRTQFPEWS